MPNIKPRAPKQVDDTSAHSAEKTRKTAKAQNLAETVMLQQHERRPVRERYAALMGFVAFARGEAAVPPGIPLRFSGSISWAREHIDMVLRRMAEFAAQPLGEGQTPSMHFVMLPPPPASRLTFIGGRLFFTPAHDVLLEIVESLARVSQETENLSRLKVCPICDKLFVALNKTASGCTPRCLNTLRQRKFWAAAKAEDEEKAKALAAEYRAHAVQNRVQLREKKRLRLTGHLRQLK